MKLSYILMSFLFVLSILYADNLDTVVGQISLPADFANIISAGMIGVSIGIFIAALAYMIGNFFGLPQMIGWSKNQLWESIYTMVLVSSVLVFSIAVHMFPLGVPEAIQSNTQISFPEKAAMSLDNVIYGQINLADLPSDVKKQLEETGFITTENIGIKRLFYLSYVDQIFLNVAYNVFRLEVGTGLWKLFEGVNAIFAEGDAKFTGPFLSGFKKLMGLSGMISNYFLSLMLVLYAQLGLLIFAAGGSIFLFTFGVFFRCIPYTRKLGSTLIALFIVLYFIYPAFVIFVYSEGMYGKMAKDFEGMYVQNQWFEGMEGIDPQGIIIVEPYGLNQVEKDEDVFMRFHSFIFPVFNYTVKSGITSICSGSNIMSGEIIECNLKSSIPKTKVNPNTKTFNEDLEKMFKTNYDNKNPDFSKLGTEVKYNIEITYSNGTHSFKYPENKPLTFSVFYSEKCVNDFCFQTTNRLSKEMEIYTLDNVREELLGSMVDQLKEGYTEGKVADLTITATKGILLGLGTYFSAGKMTVMLTGLLFKNDISGFFYDEVTCDPYTNAIAVDYFKVQGDLYPKPIEEDDGGSFEFIKSISEFFRDGGALHEKAADYYGRSDYMSCTNALGYESGEALSSFFKTLGGTKGWTTKHLSVIFAPIVYVFISFIYTMVFCITFFKSLSESIGGDSSLMGLGKLL